MVMLSVRRAFGSVALIATVSACSGAIGDVEPGLLSLQLQPAAAVQLSLLKYTVSHERGFVRTGPVAIGAEQTFTFKVDTLPPAYGYVVSAYAEGTITKANVRTVCTGQASFEIKTAQATAVSMRLQCDGVARTGSGNGSAINNCPSVGVISAVPAQAPVGQDVQLRAEVPADNDGPLPVTYQWQADSGILSSPGAVQTRFLCNRPGVVALHLTLSDGDPACDESPATVYVTCTDADCLDLTRCAGSPVVQTTAPSKAVPPSVARPVAMAGRSGALAGQAGIAGSAPSKATGGSAAAGRPAATAPAAARVDKDAGTAQAGSGGSPWGDPWPDPNDTTPENMQPRESRGRRDRDAAGSGGRTQTGGGAGADAPAPEAGAGGSNTLPDSGTGGTTEEEADAGRSQ